MSKASIAQIKEIFREASINELEAIIETYLEDSRNGVQKLIESARKRIANHSKELERLEQMQIYENSFADRNYICGVDEVGRGPLAGPVVTAAVILPHDCQILYINDSKKLSQKMREAIYDEIMDKAVAVSIGIEGVDVIDEINILQATLRAMKKAVENLEVKPDVVLADAVTIPDVDIEQVAIVKGDEKSISIAAASIIAKVTRDKMMVDYHEVFPDYCFDSNKGYGSKQHIEALKKIGACPIHRRSFIKNFV